MNRILVIIMIVLWVSLIVITGVNMFNQFLVNKQSMRLIKTYQMKSGLSPAYTALHDSLNKEIAAAESLSIALSKPFPLTNQKTNWIFLRLAIIFMSLVSGITLWIYRKNKAST